MSRSSLVEGASPCRDETRPSRVRRARTVGAVSVIAAAFVSFAALALIGMPVYVEGRRIDVPPWAKVDDLVHSMGVTAPSGDIVDVDGNVLERGGGGSGIWLVNGEEPVPGMRVRMNDRVSVVAGAPVIEEIVVKADRSAPPVKVTGSGSFVEVRSLGEPGIVWLKTGATTGKVFGSREVRPATPASAVRVQYRCPAKIVVLTFDDGPDRQYTDQILDVLKEEQVKAVFFVIGSNAERYPAAVKRIAEEGHEIGNHTYSHRLTSASSEADAAEEINKASDIVKGITGVGTKWLRPPGGELSAAFLAAASTTGHRFALWNVDTRDWEKARAVAAGGVDRIVSAVVDAPPGNGSVILMHDGGGPRRATVQALRRIIPDLKAQGYKFYTLSELYHYLGLD